MAIRCGGCGAQASRSAVRCRIGRSPPRATPGQGPRARLHQLRARIAAQLLAHGDDTGLVRGLSLGDGDALAPDDREVFHRLGLEHALSVSGLHLTWVSAALYAGEPSGAAPVGVARGALRHAPARAHARERGGARLRRARGVGRPRAPLAARRDRGRAGGAARASTACGRVARGGGALDPRSRARGVVRARRAALVRGDGRVRVGAATARRFRTASDGERSPWNGLRTSATAIAATAPILAWHGGGVSSVALVANAIALPWLGLAVLPAALAAAVAARVRSSVRRRADPRRGCDLVGAIAVLGAIARELPALDQPAPSLGWWCAAVALGALGLTARATAVRAAIAVVLAVLLAVAPPAPIAPEPPRLVVLDVGQGDSALVQGTRGALLVDAGPARDDFDAGVRRVVPALRALGVARLDLVVATTPISTTAAALPAVLRAIPVAELWLPWGSLADPGFAEVIEAARAAGTRVRETGRGSPRRRIGELVVDPLWPPRAAHPRESRNARSLVVSGHRPGRPTRAASGRPRCARRGALARGRSAIRARTCCCCRTTAAAAPAPRRSSTRSRRRSRSPRRRAAASSGCRIPRCARGSPLRAVPLAWTDATGRCDSRCAERPRRSMPESPCAAHEARGLTCVAMQAARSEPGERSP
jgi:hypothetical protein